MDETQETGSAPAWKNAKASPSQAMSNSPSAASSCSQGRAPDFHLDYLDLADMAVHTVGLADSAGMVRLLSVAHSLERQVCQVVMRQWEALCADLPLNAHDSRSGICCSERSL